MMVIREVLAKGRRNVPTPFCETLVRRPGGVGGGGEGGAPSQMGPKVPPGGPHPPGETSRRGQGRQGPARFRLPAHAYQRFM